MPDIIRTRKVGTNAKPVPFTLLDGDGNVEDFAALSIVIARFTVRFRTLPNGVAADSAGTVAFLAPPGDGSDGRIDWTPAGGEVPANPEQMQVEIHVDFDGAGALEKYPTKDRYIIDWVEDL